jgi:hypothetical protein
VAQRPARDSGSLAPVQQYLAAKEYEASRTREGLQAPNRAQDLRTYFDPTGIRVHDRTDLRGPGLLALSLAGVGRGETLPAPATGSLSSQGARVELLREGLVEWFVNAPEGLEQGFTLAARPAGEGPLVLELAVAGAQARLRGDAVVFRSTAGRQLRYERPFARGADGTALAARLEVPGAARVRLVVEDAAAIYPLTIDPVLTGITRAQLESDQAGAFLGSSVAGAGDVNGDGYDDVIVGAPGYDAGQSDEGAAFVFLGSAAGIVSEGDPRAAAAWLESDQAGGGLGTSVAGAGDVNGDGYDDVIVGAFLYDAGQENEGAAFVASIVVDSDGDAVFDLRDNCIFMPNPSQIDSDLDGCGNACDCDFNQNGVCGQKDLRALRRCFGRAAPAAGPPDDPTCAESDLDGDGVVGGSDFIVFRTWFGSTPGPGTTCP